MSEKKNQINNQFGRVSINGGADLYTSSQNDGREPTLDEKGRLIVRMANGSGFVDPTAILQFNNPFLSNQFPILNLPCTIVDLTGYNSDPLNFLYVQLHDKDLPIVIGDIPKVIIPIQANKTSFSYGIHWIFNNGLQIGLSSTELTFTAAGSFLWINCRIVPSPMIIL